MPKFIELRSDTCTLPTDEMREVMANAVVGDDVYGEDPTVKRLEEIAAAKVGKESALFLPSGTMGNLAAVLTHCKRGEEIILESECHIMYYEAGGICALGGVVPKIVRGTNGIMNPKDVKDALRGKNIHYSPTSCITIENTHNRGGGTVYPLEDIVAIGNIAKEKGLKLHVDGARIFNAALASNVDVKELVAPCDSVQYCLSKGLSAPVGSILAGSREFIERARATRKMVGGGMRQSGIIAAAGIVALEKMIDRLSEDHDNAKELARRLVDIKGIKIDLDTVQTNIIMLDLDTLEVDSERFASELEMFNVKVTTRPPFGLRMVTNRNFSFSEIDEVEKAVRAVAHKLFK